MIGVVYATKHRKAWITCSYTNLHQTYSPQPWKSYVEDCSRRWRGDNLKNTMCKLIFGATVYMIWKERNNVCFGKGSTTKERIVATTKEIVCERAACLKNVKLSKENEETALAWGLPNCIFKSQPSYVYGLCFYCYASEEYSWWRFPSLFKG